MPRKKKEVVKEEVIEDQEVEEIVEKAKEQSDKIKYCGHINRHYIDTNGKLSDLACTLAPGHQGDHSAPTEKNVSEPIVDKKGIVVDTKWHTEPTLGFWNDAAGKPAAEIQGQVVVGMTAYQKDLVLDALKRNPTRDVDTVVAELKMQENWNIQKRA